MLNVWCQDFLYSYNNKESVRCEDGHVDQWNTTQSLKIDPHVRLIDF